MGKGRVELLLCKGGFDVRHVGAGDGEGVVGVLDDELHGAGIGNYLLHLGEVDEEGAVAADHFRRVLQRLLHLLGSGAEHVATHLAIAQMIHLHVVAHGLDIEQVADVQRESVAGVAVERNGLIA